MWVIQSIQKTLQKLKGKLVNVHFTLLTTPIVMEIDCLHTEQSALICWEAFA